jgi:hypothetical protein
MPIEADQGAAFDRAHFSTPNIWKDRFAHQQATVEV